MRDGTSKIALVCVAENPTMSAGESIHTSYQLQPAVMPSTHPNKCGGSVGFTFPNMVETTYGFCLKMGNIKNNVAIIGYSCLMRKTDLGISYAATGAMSKHSSFRFLVRISTVGRMTIPHK